MRVFILAAGEGSRLQPYTNVLPKALIHVKGKPCIRWIIERLVKQGFNEIVLCINENFFPHFKHEFRDIHVEYSTSPNPLGTAGEIVNAKNFVEDTFMIHYGDELTNVNLRGLSHLHKRHKDAIGTLAVVRGVPLPVGLVELEKNLIKVFKEKPPLKELTWCGIAVLEPEILKYANMGDDFALDIFPKVLSDDKRLYAYFSRAKWIQIGSIERLKVANESSLDLLDLNEDKSYKGDGSPARSRSK